METERNTPNFDIETKKRILAKLNEAVVFENFLGTKFLGQKRFSLEGAEAVIPALDSVIQKGAELGIEEFVIGMAHRGRLNILANIMHKTYKLQNTKPHCSASCFVRSKTNAQYIRPPYNSHPFVCSCKIAVEARASRTKRSFYTLLGILFHKKQTKCAIHSPTL